jgi:hypothetical protein
MPYGQTSIAIELVRPRIATACLISAERRHLMPMVRFRPVLSLVVRCALLSLPAACSGQNSLGSPTGATCPPSSTLSYDNFGKAFMDNNCNSCHGDRFASQQGVQDSAMEIDRAAASGPNGTNTYMPKNSDVPDADRQKLGEWLACGAP